MVKNFRANKATCPDGHEYLVNHQSAECPHERFVDLMVNKDRLPESIKRLVKNACGSIFNMNMPENLEDFATKVYAKTASIIAGKIHKDLVALQLDSPNVYEKSRRLEEYVSSMLSRILGGK